jgi:hypothetical protein
MKKIISTLALCSLCLSGVNAHAALDEEKILRQLEELQKTVVSQQAVIEELKQKILANEKNITRQTIKPAETPIQESPAASGIVTLANKAIDQLEIKGDLRIRYESRHLDMADGGNENQDRFRTRFRLGGIWKNKTENWELGAGLITGDARATATNNTWSNNSNPFNTGGVNLDYAYGRHVWNNFVFTAGQQIDPYKNSWVMWDNDVRFSGFTAAYKPELGIFATVGGYGAKYYKVDEPESGTMDYKDHNTAMIYMGQAGFTGKVDKFKYTVAVGTQIYDHSFINDEHERGCLEYVDPDKYRFEIGDIYGDVKFPLNDRIKMSMYGHIWNNFGADGHKGEGQLGGNIDPEDESLGMSFGVGAKIAKYKLDYSYIQVGADSLYGRLMDGDVGTGMETYIHKAGTVRIYGVRTDVEGHKFSLGYNFTRNFSTTLVYQFYKAMERNDQPDSDLYWLQMLYKF